MSKLLDMNIFKDEEGGILDYYLVEVEIRCLMKWIGRVGKMEEGMKVCELIN